MSEDQMTQYAPWPVELDQAIAEFRYEPGWRFWLSDEVRDFADQARTVPLAGGLTFNIHVPCQDSYHPDNYRPVHHSHPVPAATFNRQSWEDWMLACLMRTVTHEMCEWARFEREVVPSISGQIKLPTRREVRRPWAPTHGPGDDPYVVRHYASNRAKNTSFRGVVKETAAEEQR